MIHRYLLVLGQVYSLHRNFQVRHTVQEQPGIEFQSALDRLKDALADTSATLMGLVPGISVAFESAAPIARSASGPTHAAFQSDQTEHTAYATVTLANQGSRPVELVKIGIDQTSLPAGVRCLPEEPALFGSVAAGHTARMTYVLKWNGAGGLPEDACVGDISYFTAGAPAHLRPHSW
jgi:hypothetical protein